MSGYSETKYSASGVRTGAIMPHGDSSAPVGFLNCDGTAVSRTTYASLFGVIGTTYGSGDGASTFNLPDLRDNVAVGKSSSKSIGSIFDERGIIILTDDFDVSSLSEDLYKEMLPHVEKNLEIVKNLEMADDELRRKII